MLPSPIKAQPITPALLPRLRSPTNGPRRWGGLWKTFLLTTAIVLACYALISAAVFWSTRRSKYRVHSTASLSVPDGLGVLPVAGSSIAGGGEQESDRPAGEALLGLGQHDGDTAGPARAQTFRGSRDGGSEAAPWGGSASLGSVQGAGAPAPVPAGGAGLVARKAGRWHDALESVFVQLASQPPAPQSAHATKSNAHGAAAGQGSQAPEQASDAHLSLGAHGGEVGGASGSASADSGNSGPTALTRQASASANNTIAPIPVWWMAPFFDRTSFGREAALLVLGMLRCDVAVRSSACRRRCTSQKLM
jgi:hypothetical protein